RKPSTAPTIVPRKPAEASSSSLPVKARAILTASAVPDARPTFPWSDPTSPPKPAPRSPKLPPPPIIQTRRRTRSSIRLSVFGRVAPASRSAPPLRGSASRLLQLRKVMSPYSPRPPSHEWLGYTRAESPVNRAETQAQPSLQTRLRVFL